MTKYDFIAIGDMTTDAFIRIKDASVNCDVNEENCMLSMRFGDKIPYEDTYIVPAVGNAANAAVSAKRLGLNSALVSTVGDDRFGEEAVETLKKEGVSAEFIDVESGKQTNYHYVLWYEDERTILIKHQPYSYQLPYIDAPRWVYFSSMGETSLAFHEKLLTYLKEYPDINLAFQPGTFQMKFGTERMRGFYERAYITFYNKEEAQRILATEETDIKKLLDSAHGLGTQIAVITDGKAGAYAFDGNAYYYMPIYPDPKPPLERTGVGDAFSSAFAAFIALGMKLEDALTRAPINSMSVAQHVGAREGLLTRDAIEEYLAQAPADYKISTL
jgi:sugar/nucleoside kinase (ribokinase family)